MKENRTDDRDRQYLARMERDDDQLTVWSFADELVAAVDVD